MENLLRVFHNAQARAAKKDPHQPMRFRVEGVQNRKPLNSRSRILVHTELFSHPTPHKTRQKALKENVIHCFDLPT
jgi:hypothetical protein